MLHHHSIYFLCHRPWAAVMKIIVRRAMLLCTIMSFYIWIESSINFTSSIAKLFYQTHFHPIARIRILLTQQIQGNTAAELDWTKQFLSDCAFESAALNINIDPRRRELPYNCGDLLLPYYRYYCTCNKHTHTVLVASASNCIRMISFTGCNLFRSPLTGFGPMYINTLSIICMQWARPKCIVDNMDISVLLSLFNRKSSTGSGYRKPNIPFGKSGRQLLNWTLYHCEAEFPFLFPLSDVNAYTYTYKCCCCYNAASPQQQTWTVTPYNTKGFRLHGRIVALAADSTQLYTDGMPWYTTPTRSSIHKITVVCSVWYRVEQFQRFEMNRRYAAHRRQFGNASKMACYREYRSCIFRCVFVCNIRGPGEHFMHMKMLLHCVIAKKGCRHQLWLDWLDVRLLISISPHQMLCEWDNAWRSLGCGTSRSHRPLTTQFLVFIICWVSDMYLHGSGRCVCAGCAFMRMTDDLEAIISTLHQDKFPLCVPFDILDLLVASQRIDANLVLIAISIMGRVDVKCKACIQVFVVDPIFATAKYSHALEQANKFYYNITYIVRRTRRLRFSGCFISDSKNLQQIRCSLKYNDDWRITNIHTTQHGQWVRMHNLKYPFSCSIDFIWI